MFRYCLIVAAALPLAGCAASSTSNHINPPSLEIENEATLNKPFDEVWDGMIANLAKSFFVINNVDKTSRIINVSFSADQPGDLIDCGTTTRTYKRGAVSENYSYKTTDPASYLISTPNGMSAAIQRTTSLEGRANIYVAPKDQKTNISVNARYVFTVNGTVTPLNEYGQPVGYPSTQPPFSRSFETKEPGKFTDPDGMSWSCQTNGTLERKILEAAGVKP